MINFGMGVSLASLDEADPEVLRTWRNDYRIFRHCRQRDLISKKKQQSWFETNQELLYSIIPTPSSKKGCPEIVGICGLTNTDFINRRAEFSLYIAPSQQGKGLGKASLKTLISHGFNAYGFESIWGESFESNPARKMFISIGMTEDGKRRNFYYREGKFLNAFLYCILRNEWDSSKIFEGFREPLCS